jgi:hypothetical protein
MKSLIALIAATTFIFTLPLAVTAASYSTEATVTLHKDKNQYEVAGRVCRLIEQEGMLTEEVIARPKVLSSPGSPASFYVGLGHSDRNYPNEENVTMDVSWPKKGERGFAICTITIKRGDKIVSKSKTQVQVGDN